MICPKCNNKGVYNEVLGKGFYYCRECKIEIVLETPSDTRDDPDEEWSLEDQDLWNTRICGILGIK